MELYLLKFSGCLLIFLTFYKLVLEKESMHVFKRFFLLGALVLAIVIPLVTFTQYVEPVSQTIGLSTQDALITNDIVIAETNINYVPYIIWSVYIIGVLLFGFKFIRNLYQLNHKIKHNPKQRYNKFTHVLLKDLIVPHTFFNYIFFNKYKLEANKIPEEVFWHEQTHASQKHSIDVIFIEALQVLLWFNPLIYIIKHAIKLNHEFLADQGVLQKGINTNTYQEIILAFSSNAVQPQLANAINYSLIKKRFTVMKTQTTKRGIWLRSLILLPLLAVMLYSFSDTKVIEKDVVSKTSITNHTARSIDIEVFNNGTYKIDGIKATKETFISVINQLHQDITPEIRNQIINVHVNNGKAVSDEDVWFIYNSVIDYGFHRIVTHNQEIIREKGNKPFAIANNGKQEDSKDSFEQQKATKAQIKEYNKLAKKYNDMSKDDMHVKKSDMERLKYIYSIMTAAQKKDAESFPNIPPPPPAPKALKVIEVEEALPPPPPPIPADASPEQRKKYEKAIKMYKEKAAKVKSMLPPPPPPLIPDNATPEQRKKYEEIIKQYKLTVAKSKQNMARVREVNDAERAELIKVKEQYATQRKAELTEVKLARVAEMKERQEKLKQEKLQRVVEREAISEERRKELAKTKLKRVEERQVEIEKRQEKLKKEKLKHVEERKVLAEQKREYAKAVKLKREEENLARREMNIPPPPPPKSPLDHVIDMAKKNAVFYFEGKEISSDEAIKKLKMNKKMNIRTISWDSNKPKVYLSTKPIVVEKN